MCIVFSANGNYGYALSDEYGANDNIIYYWNGVQWDIYTALGVDYWISAALSSDGQYQAIVTNGGGNNGKMYISSNYGVNWSTDVKSGIWFDVCMSATGQYITAVSQYDNVYVSNNYGASFTGNINSSHSWYACCMNATGQYQLAVADNSGNADYAYYSTNYGATWTQISSSSAVWTDCAMNATGSCWVLSKSDGSYIITYNYGGTFLSSTTANNISTSINFSSNNYLTCVNSSGIAKYIQFSTIN